MGWREDVLSIMPELPQVFTTADIYGFVPWFRHRHPENSHIEEKIRQVLQALRDEGKISFLEGGAGYRKLAAVASPRVVWPFKKGQETTRAELANVFGQAGPAGLGRGMFRPGKESPWNKHMVLFHNEAENMYGDVVEAGRIIYVGEGQRDDQLLTRNNRHLAHHVDEGVTVHYFVQPAGRPGKVRYEGEVVVESFRYTYRPAEGRSVFEFVLLERLGPKPLQSIGSEMADIQRDARPPGYEDRREVLTTSRRLARDPAFRTLVLSAYERKCAVCGDPLKRDPLIDVQAAHVVPVTERGRDTVDNGLGLCVRHHWAFDNGFFAVRDNFRIVWLAPVEDPHGEVRDGETISVPARVPDRPARFYLAHHRRKWDAGFRA